MKDEIIFTPFYSTFLSLCERDKISPTQVAKKAGISSGAPTAWKKKGAIPRPEQLRKLCALFNVSEKEILGYEKEKPALIVSDLTGDGQKEKPAHDVDEPMPPKEYRTLTLEHRKIVDDLIRSLAAQNPK